MVTDRVDLVRPTNIPGRAELTDIHLLSGFETTFKPELASIPHDVAAYQQAFNEPMNAHRVLVDIWSLGAPEVHMGGHTATVYVENQPDLYGRPREVIVIRNGYHPTTPEGIQQTTTFELIGPAQDESKSVVALRMTHEDIKAKGPYKMQTLLSKVTPDKFKQMVAAIRSGASK